MKIQDKYGIIMNTKKIKRIKYEYEIETKIRKKKPHYIAYKAGLEHRTAPNLLFRKFKVSEPDKVYSTDITYLYYGGGLGYLSAVKDLATTEIVAWDVSGNLCIKIGQSSLEERLSKKQIDDLMIQTDQGVHYTHPSYIELVERYGVTRSMSRKGNCLDNAPIESFFGHMKDEIDLKSFRNLEELKKGIDEYMRYYNNERRQWGLKRMTPVEYRGYLLSCC